MRSTIVIGVLIALLAGCTPVVEQAGTPGTSPVQATATTAGSLQTTATGALPSATVAAAVSPLPTAATAGAVSPLPTEALPASPAAAAQPVIHVVRSGGFAGKTETWSIFADGRVVSSAGADHSVAPDQVEQLANDLAASGLFGSSGPGGLGPGSCRDCYNYEITVTSGGQTRTVHFTENPGTLPSGAADALARLSKILSSAP